MVDLVIQGHKTRKGLREVAALYTPATGTYLYRKDVDTLLNFQASLEAAGVAA